MKFIAQSNQISTWLAKLSEQYKVLAPKAESSRVVYDAYTKEELEKANLANLMDYTTTSLKKAYIPQAETLFSYTSTKNPDDLSKVETKLDATVDAPKTVIFGARPCDAKGVEVLDAAYLHGKYQDPYYQAHKDNIVLVAQACTFALPTCFCNWTDTDLTSAHGADVLFTPLEGDTFLFEAFSEKGKELLAAAGFGEASANDVTNAEAVHAKAHETLPQKPDMTNLPAMVAYNFENKDFWSKVSSGCIGCSSCTFVCPTCQCFTITDEGNPLEGKRIRSWASCMGNEFTLEASGHNPRPAGFTRWRNRLGHKFNYVTSWHDIYACTGCGRCLISCPASISIKDMISGVIEVTPKDADLANARGVSKKAAVAAAPKAVAQEVAKEEAPKEAQAPKAEAEAKKPATKKTNAKG